MGGFVSELGSELGVGDDFGLELGAVPSSGSVGGSVSEDGFGLELGAGLSTGSVSEFGSELGDDDMDGSE